MYGAKNMELVEIKNTSPLWGGHSLIYTSANYKLTPGKYPKEHFQYSNHGESLKSRMELVKKRVLPSGKISESMNMS